MAPSLNRAFRQVAAGRARRGGVWRLTMPPLLSIEVHSQRFREALPASRYQFPDASHALPDGLLAGGGDFEPGTIVAAYRAGAFPWPHPEFEHLWFSPDPRAILPVGGLHVSRRLARTLRQQRFRATVDAAFERVIAACQERAEGTWITDDLREAYVKLHHLGWAHSVETWTPDGRLAGGLYGIGVGAMFGAESMFHAVTDGSKAAMAALMQHAEAIGLRLIDIQVLTPHTERMGGVLVPRYEYLKRLREALRAEADWVR